MTVHLSLANGGYACIDAGDFDAVRGYRWVRIGRGSGHEYAATYSYADGRASCVLLQRMLLGASRGQVVIFKDYNGLNCVRDNMCLATRVEQGEHKRPAKKLTLPRNVRKHPDRPKPYRAAVRHAGKEHQQAFATIEEADAWADAKRAELHGALAYRRGKT